MRAALEEILETSPQLQGYLKFDSRVHILEQTIQALQDPDIKQILISGIGGVGKTTLVNQITVCAAELALFDGIVKASFAAQQLEGVQRQLANALGLKLNEFKGRGEQIHRSLTSGKFLVIVEDVWKWEEEDKDLLCSKIGIPLGCKILLTHNQLESRSARRPNESIHVNVGVLEEEEACRLFSTTVGNDGNHPDLDVIGRRVVKRCKGLPVLIVTIAAALSKRPTLSAWEGALVQLELMKNVELHEYVNSAVEFICYNYLPDPHKSLFLLCGLLQNTDGDQIAVSYLRSEWSRLEGMGHAPSLDELVLDLKALYLLLKGEMSNYVKMHDLVCYGAIEIANKVLKAQDAIQYSTGGSMLGHTRLSRLLERVVPDSEMKNYTLLKELKALNRMKDLVSLVSSYSVTRNIMVRKQVGMNYIRNKILKEFSHLNPVRKEQLLHTCTFDSQETMEYIESEFSQIKPFLEDVLSYFPLDMIEDLGKVPELKALVELRTQMEATRCQYEELTEEEPVPKAILEFAIESAIHHITTSMKTVDWVGISGKGRHEVVQAFKKDMAEKFENVFSVIVTEDWSSRIGQIEGDITKGSTSLYLIDLHESVDVSEWIQVCTKWDLLRWRKLLFISTSPISCLPVDLQIRMEDHLLPWKLFCRNAGPIVRSPVAELLVKYCGGNLTANILMARALRDVSDLDVWREILIKIIPLMVKTQDVLDVAVHFVAKRHRWDVITKNFIGYALLECQPNYGSSINDKSGAFLESPSDSQWVDRTALITRWRSGGGHLHSEKQGLEILNSLVDAFLFEYSLSKPELTRVKPELYEVISSILELEKLDFNVKRPTIDFPGFECSPASMNGGCITFDYGGTDLYELPVHIRYLIQKLVVQDNPELTIIPPCFFESMEVLKVLNMSNTSIKTLPESFFKLSTLTELVLRDCRLFMELPPQIGKLVSLTVLDLEGTEIIQLPVEVRNLINLTRLKVSFYGYGELPEIMIPSGVLVKLVKLSQLNIDVNPDDARWEKNVKVVMLEVFRLKELKNLKMYLPRVKQLDDLRKHFPSLLFSEDNRFHFTVGSHFERIMSRTPLGVETEFQKRNKCLRYIHGSKIHVKRLGYALQFFKAFFLDRDHTATKLSQFGTDNMRQLEFCVLGECNELQTVIEDGPHSRRGDYGGEDNEIEEYSDGEEYSDEEDGEDDSSILTVEPVLQSLEHLVIYSMENLRSVWVSKLSIHNMSFSRLKSLSLYSCPQLSTIFNLALLGNLGMLEELILEDCESIEKLVDPHHQPSNLPSKPFLPNLKKISLHYLPELVSICSGLHIAPKLEYMSFYNCPNLKSLSDKEVSSKHLKKIRGEEEWWNGLQWDEAEWKEGRPSNLANIFIPFKEDEDLVTQLADNENPAKASSTDTKPTPQPSEEEWWNGLQWDEAEWKESRPSDLANIFIPFKKDEDLMTQLADNENPVKASSTDTKPTTRPALEKRQQVPSAYNRVIKSALKTRQQRVPSAYNRFVKDEILRIKAGNPDISHREAFSAAAKNWAHFAHIGLMPDQTAVKKPNMRQLEGDDGGQMKDGFFASANVGVSPYYRNG